MSTTYLLLELAHDHILANILIEIYNKLLFYFVLFTFEHDLTHAHCDQLSQHRASKALHTIKYSQIQGVRFSENEVENTIHMERFIHL